MNNVLPHSELFVFDIETIPDDMAAAQLIDESLANKGVEERRQALTDYHLEATANQNPFLRQPFHRVVAISFLRASLKKDESGAEIYSLKEIRSGGALDSTEAQLIDGFFKVIEKIKPRLVSFNGRGFDIPVLKYRAIKHGIAAPYFHRGGDKWNSYHSRYSSDWHCDLLDVLSDFGASARIRLNEVCAILGLPGKLGVDGSQVMPMIDEGRLGEVRDYCETDVLNTYLVYLHTMHHSGRISTEVLQSCLQEVREFLFDNSMHKHWKRFLEAWESH